MDQRTSRTDPLSNVDHYAYDLNGNLTQHTDRRGKVTNYGYDGLDRRNFAGYGYTGSSFESTINFTFDQVDRLTAAVDSIAGTISRTYNLLDNLKSETTPQGEVSYSYDVASRRNSMSVTGQSDTSYTWDDANRLTGITQGTSSVSFGYDDANRRTSLALPNGIVLTYGYDNDSRVNSMNWALGSTQIGNLAYNFDADGRITGKSGTMANTNLPAPVNGDTFNASNQMTVFGPKTLVYDNNGNLTDDGTNTYSWDARNHLISISGSARHHSFTTL
jgi:YD repeat-containing protein